VGPEARCRCDASRRWRVRLTRPDGKTLTGVVPSVSPRW
jgi:hypothetical protein